METGNLDNFKTQSQAAYLALQNEFCLLSLMNDPKYMKPQTIMLGMLARRKSVVGPYPIN